MKYLFYIFLVVLLFTVSILGLEFVGRHRGEKDAAVEVNRKVITNSEFSRRHAAQSSFTSNPQIFMDSVITKELLVQEAIKQGIDKEPAFRDSVQNFYEQLLIKSLTERMLGSMKVTADEKEINRYLELSQKQFHITLFTFDTFTDISKKELPEGKKWALCFQDLTGPVREKILDLEPDKTTAPFSMEGKFVVMKLDRVTRCPGALQNTGREAARKLIEEDKKTRLMDDWIENLRKKAEITIHIKETRQND